MFFGFHCVAASQIDSANLWIEEEFQPSTLSKSAQIAEMNWFIEAARPYKGMQIRVVSETLNTHEYEANRLAKAFYQITGIHVVHELTGEDDVVKKMSAQMLTGQNLYDAYISDSDLIGTHFRSGKVLVLSDFMQGQGKQVTLPSLDLNDFIGLKFTTGPDGKLYQLPDQQFANLYWYRHDWFSRPDFKRQFKDLYGYELGVPQNWQAYEDIAEFFGYHVKTIDGTRVYGHYDYAKPDPSVGWRISDAWLSMAGVGDIGLPNGLPVDEWGIRVDQCRPVGASVARGGALNSPAAKYAMRKYIDWLNKFAPEDSKRLTFKSSLKWLKGGQVAQQIFWYTAFVPDVISSNLAIVNPDGTPKWRVAPSPVGKYWRSGMKSGYQDAGSWTILKSTPLKNQQAAWLYAQFVVSKTVSLRKTMMTLTPIRRSDIDSQFMTAKAPYLGGLVEFYRSNARDVWTPTGTNVPDYPGMAQYWWRFISDIILGKLTVDEGMDQLANKMDQHLFELSHKQGVCSPQLNPIQSEQIWLDKPGSPKRFDPLNQRGRTLPYQEAINVWQ
ncbi:ABC transporter substrate-binding protein [Shewanella gelidii]|nr:ABC transporter substrate-binding protein [Shewanella gelidii]MCL1098592.1 ABC transporter substrate-binding protein [Shewanella gelidii]